MIQSESGFLSVTGTEDEPTKAGRSIADIAAGMYAYSNILAALIERVTSGRGRRIDISMLECMAEWMSFPLYYTYDGADPPPRAGAAHATIFPYGPFRCDDGTSVMLGVQNEREWQAFCEQVLLDPSLMRDPRFASNPNRIESRVALRERIENVFASLDADQATARLDAAQIANAKVNDMRGLWTHRQVAARDRWREIDTAAGPVKALRPPGLDDARMDAVPSRRAHEFDPCRARLQRCRDRIAARGAGRLTSTRAAAWA